MLPLFPWVHELNGHSVDRAHDSHSDSLRVMFKWWRSQGSWAHVSRSMRLRVGKFEVEGLDAHAFKFRCPSPRLPGRVAIAQLECIAGASLRLRLTLPVAGSGSLQATTTLALARSSACQWVNAVSVSLSLTGTRAVTGPGAAPAPALRLPTRDSAT